MSTKPRPSKIPPSPPPKRAGVNPPAAPRSEGQRLLRARPEDGAEIARQVGVTKSALSLYRSGKRLPSPDVARKLHTVFRIPVAAWAAKPRSGGRSKAARAGTGTAKKPPAAQPELKGQDIDLSGLLARALVTVRDAGASSGQRLRAAAEARQCIRDRARMERAAFEAIDVRADATVRAAAFVPPIVRVLRGYAEIAPVLEQLGLDSKVQGAVPYQSGNLAAFEQLQSALAQISDLTPSEQARAAAESRTCLAARDKLERHATEAQAEHESSVIQLSPLWARFKVALGEAMGAAPDVAKAAAKLLRALDA